MAFVIDGKPLKTVEVKAVEKEPQVYEIRVKLRGGARKVGVSFLNDYYNEKAPDPKQRDRNLVVDYLEIQGPAVTADVPKPESHKKIIFKTATRANAHEVAQEILVKFASPRVSPPVDDRRGRPPGEVRRPGVAERRKLRAGHSTRG